MATLEDIVAATKILSEDPETIMGVSVSKLRENCARASDVGKDNGGSPAGAVITSERVVESETVVESALDGESAFYCGLGDEEKEKTVVKNLSSVSCDSTSVCVNGIDSGVGVNGSCEEKRKDCLYHDVVHVDGDAKREVNDEKLKDVDNLFRVGDFVWGKIKSHPWWPGQIYDPKDASEFVMSHKQQEGCLLVAFFGDVSCSWCSPSQLIPFVENFSEMSKVSSSKSFLDAVQRAVDEVGRLVELKMTCKCIAEEKKDAVARPVIANGGLKTGVIMPEVDFDRLSVRKYEPVELLERIKDLAKAVSISSALDLVVLKSWLSAFYYFRGGYLLPVYYEPLHIEGLEDKDENVNEVTNDFCVPIEVPVLGPRDDDWLSSPTLRGLNSQTLSDNKILHKRKQKSVAELMAENKNIKTESRKRNVGKEGTDFEKSAPSKKRKKNNDGEVEGSLLGKPKEIEVADTENISNEAKEESEMVSTPRERKKSKYLSPPYTDLTWRIGNSSFKTESKFEYDKNRDASGDVFASQPVWKSLDEASEGKLPNGQLEKLDVSIDKKMTFPVSDVDAPVNELLLELQFAAVDPLYLSKEGSLEMVWAFISALRSSTYLHGPNYKIYRKCKTGGKRKSFPSSQENLKKAKSPDQSTPKALTNEEKSDISKSKKAAETFAEKNTAENNVEGKTLPCLILAFTPEFPLPSKEDIMRLFDKFGSLNTKKTKVMRDSHSIQIVYIKDSDAETAFKSSLNESPFGSENVNYKLQRTSASSRSRRSHTKVSSPLKSAPDKRDSCDRFDDLISDASVIRQKLEITTAILENYHSKFSTEEKSSLKDEMKHLMEKVETISEKVRVMAENTSS